MSRPSTLIEQLVATAFESYDEAEARRAGGRALFDYLACLGAGQRMALAGMGDAGAAAAVDRDDLHWPSLTHPGSIVWTVLRGIGAEGPALWHASHAGYEVTARLGGALGEQHRRFWHVTTTAGTVGAAVAAAVALGTDPVNAAAHAVSVSGGSILCILERTGTRLVHRDHAAATGLRCARMGHLTAAHDALEHQRGMLVAMGGSAERLVEPRVHSALSEVSFRRHATSGFSQALVDAALELAPISGTEPVLVEAPDATVALAGIAVPRDEEEAWWSARHAVAVTLLGLDLEDASLVGDPRVVALGEAIRLAPGATSRVTVAGRSAEHATAAALSDEDLIAKWHQLNPGTCPPREILV